MIPYLSCFTIKFTDFDKKRTNTESVFPGYVEVKEPEPVEPNFSEFKLDELTWISIGQLILDLYKTFEDNDWGKHTIMTLKDFWSNTPITDDKMNETETETQIGRVGDDLLNGAEGNLLSPTIPEISDVEKDNSNSNEDTKCTSSSDQQVILSADGSADDSDATKPNDATAKPKQSRRRGSDLKFLEQWGWHKTKKVPVQRKKNTEQNDAESSINGILRRILSKHFE